MPSFSEKPTTASPTAARHDWPSYGLNAAETRFSDLAQVNANNVSRLGLVWSYDLKAERGVETTPLVIDGTLYATGPWSLVYALDARTGKERWTYDPQVPRSYGEKACCDVVNRGVAFHHGTVFVGTLDGRLIALNAKTGRKKWEQQTVDPAKPYTITGAPRVVKGRVLIGNGGAEYGVRGYLSAYEAETGRLAWRFFSVPGDPSQPFESPALERAAKTWNGEWWKAGGGGTMWDAMAYDPDLDLLYVGTGNGSPWNRRHRSPGGGDNLYVSSIVALRPDTGEYVWHYQTTPGDTWDYTATQHLILADLTLGGTPRKVIMQAPKNGFFYVIDRTNGAFISAKPYVPVNWATGIDPQTGRPVEVPGAAYQDKSFEPIPGPYGGHNWHPMAFNPQTGLVYIPAQTIPLAMGNDPLYAYNQVTATPALAAGNGWNTGVLPAGGTNAVKPFGRLLAWNPVSQQPAWQVEHPAPGNGGVLTTAGNLVFQGTADGRLVAYDARTGQKHWETPTGTGVLAPPITYQLDGKQYVTVAAGWGGSFGLSNAFSSTETTGKLYTFALNGKAKLPAFAPRPAKELVSGVTYNVPAAGIQLGAKLFLNYCVTCHGMPGTSMGGRIPNLGYSPQAVIQNLATYVLEGAMAAKGMPVFKGRLTEADVEKLKAFIQVSANQARTRQGTQKK